MTRNILYLLRLLSVLWITSEEYLIRIKRFSMAQAFVEPWEKTAAAKRASTYAKIPIPWRFDQEDLKKASEQRDLTGQYIEKYLEPEEIAIINLPAASIVSSIRDRRLNALQVTSAFCERAALAQQMVFCFQHSHVSGSCSLLS